MLFSDLTVECNVVYRSIGRGHDNSLRSSQGGDAIGCGLLSKPERGNWRTEFRYRTVYSMVYLLQGSGTYETASGEIHELEPGCLFHRFPETPHRTFPVWDGNWVEFFVAMPRNLCDLALETGLLDPEKPVWRIGKSEPVLDCMREIHRLFRSSSFRDTLRGIERMQSLIRIAWESHTGLDDASDDPIDQACRLLCDEALMDQPTEAIAAQVEMGVESFRKQFRKKIGISPGAFRNRYKINRACELLVNGTTSIGDIAGDLGYGDAFAFSHQFKKKMGLSPDAYRKKHHG